MAQINFIAEPGKQEVIVTSIFDVSREVVWDALTDPSLIPQWWGPEDFTTAVDKMDVGVGGTWRYIQRGPDGKEYAFHGEYREVVPGERLVYTFEFEGMPGHVSVETVTLEEHDGVTKVMDRSVFGSVEERDTALKTGMGKGAVETMHRFAELVEIIE